MRAILLACFFLSGSSGLILESLWTRQLGLVFGSTTLAISTVLATFMGGLGLGSYLAGRYADRIKNPVRAYAIAEAGDRPLRAADPADPLGVPVAQPLDVPACSAIAARCCRWCASSRSARAPADPDDADGRDAAVAGAPLRHAAVGAAALRAAHRDAVRGQPVRRGRGRVLRRLRVPAAVRRRLDQHHRRVVQPDAGGGDPASRAAASPAADGAAVSTEERLDVAAVEAKLETAALPPPPVVDARSRRAALAAFAVSGATAMTLQVLWTRTLAVLLGSSVFSFTLILLAFLIGLGVGRGRVRALEPAHAAPGPLARGAAPRRPPPPSASRTCSPTRSPTSSPGCCSRPASASTRSCSASSCSPASPCCRRRMLMGGVFPLTVRVATGGARLRRARRRQRLRAQHAGRDRRLVPVGVHRAAQAGAAEAASTPRCCSTWRWRRCCSGSRPQLSRRAAPGGVAAAVALALLGLVIPRWDLGSFSSGFFRVSIAQRVHLPQDPQARLADAQAGVLRGRHGHHRQRRSVGQDLFAQEQRQGRRVERRRHADADHRRPAAVPVLQPADSRPRSRWSATARA